MDREEDLLCVSPLTSTRGVSKGKEGCGMEWLLPNIKDLLNIAGVSIVGREHIVLEFLSSVLW